MKLDHIEVTMFSLSTHFMLSASYAVMVIQSRTQCNNTENVQSASPGGKEHRRLRTNRNQLGHKQGFMTDYVFRNTETQCIKPH